MPKLLLTSALAFTLIVNAFGQQDKLLRDYFNTVRAGKAAESPNSIISSSKPEEVVSLLVSYLNDSTAIVRSKSITLLRDVALKTTNLAARKRATHLLVLQIAKNNQLTISAIAALKKFKKEDFEPSSKDSLTTFVGRKYQYKDELLRLIGFVCDKSAIESIRPFSASSNTKSVRWSALLAMARLGDDEAATSILERVQKLKVNDDVVLQLFPDLIYARNKAIIEYTVGVLQSNEANCESADNDRPTAILCGYRVMELLAPAIKNYPLSLDPSGDVKTNDYKKALETVREWFRQMKGTYQIDDSRF